MPESRIDALVDALTVEEAISLLAGKDTWTTVPVQRLGIPSIKVSDGPNGARGGGSLLGGVTAAAFPVGIALGATWNVSLVAEVGEALAYEAQSKGARALLGPTVNMHRSTTNGRNFECYSEDPFLTAEFTVAYISALQSKGVAATVKHFIGNESEYQRATMSSDIDERTLREIYMPPFEAAVKRAKTWALMTSYNRLDGTYVSERADIVKRILKQEWGFDGVAMSDWFGTKSTVEAVEGGLDLEMPGPALYRGDRLRKAFAEGLVSEVALREAARRILRLIDRVGGFDDPVIAPERADDRPQTRALIRRAGAEAMVLLKNDGALPLVLAPNAKVAVIGPNARVAEIMGGGSAQLNPHYRISPWDGLRAALPDSVGMDYEMGAENRRLVRLLPGEVEIDYFDGPEFQGPPRHATRQSEAQFMFFGVETPGFDRRNYSARMRGAYTPEATGKHEFGIIVTGPARLLIDGEVVIDAPVFEPGQEIFNCACDEIRATRPLEAGRAYQLVLEVCTPPADTPLSITYARIGVQRVLGQDDIARAAALAQDADVAVLCVGLNSEWDGEGIDRPHIDLPAAINTLVESVAAVARKTIVVLQSGGPVTMPWLTQVNAVVQAWYPGQELGAAVADVLLGNTDPGGRLPQTFPRRLEDNPAYLNYPGEHGHVRYGEGLYIGYRYYEKKKIQPLFAFGFGLSYASFAFSTLRLSRSILAPGDSVDVEIDVANTSARDGWAVVQFYVADETASVSRPHKELKGFAKLWLKAGESKVARAKLDMRAFAYFDVAVRGWVAEAGRFEVLAATSAVDICARADVTLTAPWTELCEGKSASLES